MSTTDQATTVRLGSVVRILVGEDEETWTVAAAHDANPMASLISELSPLGASLLGRQTGETAIVRGPRRYRITILDVQ